MALLLDLATERIHGFMVAESGRQGPHWVQELRECQSLTNECSSAAVVSQAVSQQPVTLSVVK